jgi:menaquinone-9 beta-reductase
VKAPLILGAGPAGSAAAILLARRGANPVMLEAQREQGDAICGGFISWRTIQSLAELGLEAAELKGHPVSRVALFAGGKSASAPLPAGAMGISRRRLDTLLAAKAVAAGAGLERGVTVKSLEPDGSITLKDGSALRAQSLFIATGKHDLRGLGRERDEAPTLGLRVRLAPHPSLLRAVGDAIELHLFDGGYAGLMMREDGSANLCMAVRKSALSRAGSDPTALLHQLGSESPALGERLAFMDDAPGVDAIAAVPYGWITRTTRPGQFRLGDQAACIPSLAGEGNGLALASGMAAAQHWLDRGAASAPDYQRAFAQAAWRPVTTAKLLWHAAESPQLAPTLLRATRALPSLAKLTAAMTRIGR